MKNNSIEEFKKRVSYKITESARYTSIGSVVEDEYDKIPENIYEDDEEIENDEIEPLENAPDDNTSDNNAPIGPPGGGDPVMGGPEEDLGMEPEGGVEPEKEVDELQNEIIKHNISALKAIYDQIERLNGSVDILNNKLDTLSVDVEEVREPSNEERLMKRKESSYPYYFNLNDLWEDNWFEKSQNNNNSETETETRGIRKLPDGTFVADFDDLNNISTTDLKKSFNQMV
jgi:hypothetical protein